jgi:LmbE family N-acetylglucosaminyl deacetylase
MKKIIIGIFAHPDDEAFGPSGTLLMEKAAGNEVHLICATAGESGMNPDNHEELALVRLEEWKHAGTLIGADSMHQLGYKDGYLSNINYHEAAEKITAIVEDIIRNAPEDASIEFMSIDLNGITGHLDHIFVGRVTCYVFCNLKKQDKRVTRVRLACLPNEFAPEANCDWLYMEAGRTADEIGETVDARKHVDTVYQIMRAHHTQRNDGEAHIKRLGEQVAINHFLVRE